MRIRTIKPEFWKHAVMAQLAPEAQLLALALLNMCDDHGYFEADPRIIRGEVMPFREDLRSVSRDIRELVRVAWIEVRETAEHGPVGRVVNWTKHQRVSHPSASKLQVYFDASPPREDLRNDSGAAPEDVRREQGKEQGTGNREVEGEADLSAAEKVLQLDLTPPDEKLPLESWTREDFWRWAECLRRKHGLPPERWPASSKLRAWWQEARPAAAVAVLQECFRTFGDKPHWQTAKPPLPFAGFMTTWNEFLPIQRRQ